MAAQPNGEEVLLLFEKTLGKTDISTRLCLPMNCLGLLPPLQGGLNNTAAEMEVWDVKSEKARRFLCRIRREGHPKPVLTRGWKDFVKENNLEVGDKIVVFKEGVDDHQPRFRIDVEKTSTELRTTTPPGVNEVDTMLRLSIGV